MTPQEMASKGGTARAAALSPEKRSDIASRAATARWNSTAVRELKIPLSSGAFVFVPYPMSEGDYDLLIATLTLWKPNLTLPL